MDKVGNKGVFQDYRVTEYGSAVANCRSMSLEPFTLKTAEDAAYLQTFTGTFKLYHAHEYLAKIFLTINVLCISGSFLYCLEKSE